MKKLTKAMSLIMAGAMMLSLAACGSSESSPEETVNPVDKINIVDSNGQIVSGPDAEKETETPAAEAEASERKVIQSDIVFNTDDGSFTYNGKTYTPGGITLKEMVDDGLPFIEEDLERAASFAAEGTNEYSVDLDSPWPSWPYESYLTFYEPYDGASWEEAVYYKACLRFFNVNDNPDPYSDDVIHCSFIVDGVTYEPSVMSQQEIFDALPDYACVATFGTEEGLHTTLNPGEYGKDFYVVTESDSGIKCWVKFYSYNDTGAAAMSDECLAVPYGIEVSFPIPYR